MQKIAYCRMAPSLGSLEDTPQNIWGTPPYSYKSHKHQPTVFFGLYDVRDYYALWRHKGKKWVLWAGSDLRNLKDGFIWNDGRLRLLSTICPGFKWILKRILKKADHYVENKAEWQILKDWGWINASIVPSYLGEVYVPVTFKWSKPAHVYLSCGKGRQKEYGFSIVERIAQYLPDIVFHLYGDEWKTKRANVIIHGSVPKEVMNQEIKGMQGALRLNESDGFSEILAKAVLQGQYAISRLEYPLIPSFDNEWELTALLRSLTITYEPNTKARSYYQRALNNYPWNAKAKV